MNLTPSQTKAMAMLNSRNNVFLTGAAGTGKSFLIREYMKEHEDCVMLASTGVAALLNNGRTFHSFFALWNFHASFEDLVGSALAGFKTQMRVKNTDTIIIDEISMLDETALKAGEYVARECKGNSLPWGGMRVIAVGDFCQLPAVSKERGRHKKWVFDAQVWHQSEFEVAHLTEIMRQSDERFMRILGKLRVGMVDAEVKDFMAERSKDPHTDHAEATRIFGLRDSVKDYNMEQCLGLEGEMEMFKTDFQNFTLFEGDTAKLEKFKDLLPFESTICLKKGALVMTRYNDPDQGFANGSLGHYRGLYGDHMQVELLTGKTVNVEMKEFAQRDGAGEIQIIARNYPVCLAYATTIHKAQGATMDAVIVDLKRLWESGQAYVAMSRCRTIEGLYVLNWQASSIFLDERVKTFYSSL